MHVHAVRLHVERGTWILFLGLLGFFCSTVCAVRPGDAVTITSLGETFYLCNEVYSFRLTKLYQVPLTIIKHTIYTGSQSKITTAIKRTLFEKRHSLFEFSEEEYDHISRFYHDDNTQVPSYIRVDKKKRTLHENTDGVIVIPLTNQGHKIIHINSETSKKRQLPGASSLPLGTTECLHIPFFTTCSDDGGTQAVKDAITASTNEMRTELDSYTNTNNQRDIALANTLDSQRKIINAFLTLQTTVAADILPSVAEQESINAANLAYGDQVVQSQINYLKRVTNSLLRYTNALASTDARQVAAQPSMTELFTSYQALLKYFSVIGNIPIVENRNFTWSEEPLPQDVVSNTPALTLFPLLSDSSGQPYQGFNVSLQYSCAVTKVKNPSQCNSGTDSSCVCVAQPDIGTDNPANTGYFYGPIPASLSGIFTTYLNGNMSKPGLNIIRPVLTNQVPSLSSVLSRTTSPGPVWYCVQFGPYKGLATFKDTPYLLNGIPAGYQALNSTECLAYKLRNTGSLGNKIYSLYVVADSVIVPFYSNCTADRFYTDGLVSGVSLMGYLSQYPQGYDYSSNTTVYYAYANSKIALRVPGMNTTYLQYQQTEDVLINRDMYQYHMVSAHCAINLEPEWVGMSYYLNKPIVNITGIPTGFKLNQFTINPVGELSSSLDFVYTNEWVWTYAVSRFSSNKMITDEVDILDGSKVLFVLNGTTVVDESNNFYGESNNGRDCIIKSDTYAFDVTKCIFQNNLVSYDIDNYVQGLVQTSGIARFIDKYNFTLFPDVQNDGFTFNLVPQNASDFHFYIEPDGSICPKLISYTATTSGCTFSFFFSGTGPSSFGGVSLVYGATKVANISTGFGLQNLRIGTPGQDCMLVYCRYTIQQSTVQFDAPPSTIIAASDLALQTRIYNAIDQTLNGSLTTLNNVLITSAMLNSSYSTLGTILNSLNFNEAEQFPYQNFTAMRQQVDSLIAAISSDPVDSSGACSGFFGSVTCFFSSLGSVVISIGIIIAVVIGLYCVCFKLGVAKSMSSRLMGKK